MSSRTQSQHFTTQGRKRGQFRNYSVLADKTTVVSFDVKSIDSVESVITNPSGDKLELGDLITTSSENHVILALEEDGVWKLAIKKKSLADIVLSVDHVEGPTLVSEQAKTAVIKGERLDLNLFMESPDTAQKLSYDNVKVIVDITKPSGKNKRLVVRDNGKRTDKKPSDNVVNVSLAAKERGQYDMQVSWSGKRKHDGKLLQRHSLLTYFVAENTVRVRSKAVVATRARVNDDTLEPNRFGLPVKIKSKLPLVSADTYAEVWGSDDANRLVPIGWIGGEVDIQNNVVPFSFHSGWLQQAKFSAPFVLRNIKIYGDEGINVVKPHGDVTITGLVTDQISPDTRTSVEIAYAEQADEVSGYVVSDEMLFGVDPAELVPASAAGIAARSTSPSIGAAGWRSRNPVLFLHGFCDDGSVWDQTAIRAKFPDDERLIYNGSDEGENINEYTEDVIRWLNGLRNRGQIDRIRGIVAHSHGGMVAANLLQRHRWLFTPNNRVYNPRYQIVSIGSPYNGASGLEDGSRVRGALRKYALKAVLCGDPPSEFYPSKKWKNKISSYTKSRIHSIYTDGGARDRWWHAASSTWCFGPTSSVLRGNDDGLLRNLDTIGFAGKTSYIAKKCHTPPLTKRGWQPQVRASKFADWADEQFDRFNPFCQSTRDPDGDGWGWENGRSCVVPSSSFVYCRSSASDRDGDGWGWENGRTCIVR